METKEIINFAVWGLIFAGYAVFLLLEIKKYKKILSEIVQLKDLQIEELKEQIDILKMKLNLKDNNSEENKISDLSE